MSSYSGMPKSPRQSQGNRETASATKITNSNTDRLCLDCKSNILSRFWYQISLHNGLYMLDPTEKMALNAAGILFAVLTILYLWSFWRGFVDGFAGWQELLAALPSSNPSALVGGNYGSDRMVSALPQVVAKSPESAAAALASAAATAGSTAAAEL